MTAVETWWSHHSFLGCGTVTHRLTDPEQGTYLHTLVGSASHGYATAPIAPYSLNNDTKGQKKPCQSTTVMLSIGPLFSSAILKSFIKSTNLKHRQHVIKYIHPLDGVFQSGRFHKTSGFFSPSFTPSFMLLADPYPALTFTRSFPGLLPPSLDPLPPRSAKFPF